MENEHISRAAAIAISDYAADDHPYEKLGSANCCEYNEGWNDACDDIREKLENEPAEDVAPVRHGRWIKPVPGDGEPCCSECKAEQPWFYGYGYYEPDYCPNCGARMDGKEQGHEVSEP